MSTTSLYSQHLQSVLSHLETLLAGSGFAQLAVHSGTPKVAFQDDYHYPFKANPNFLHFLPLTSHPHSWVVVKPGQKPTLIFMQPRDYWHVVPADPSGDWVAHFNIKIIREAHEAKALIGDISKTAFVGEDTLAFADWGFAVLNPNNVLAPWHWQRAYKTPYEVECVYQANVRGARAHKAAHAAFVAGASEYDIHLTYLKAAQHVDHELPYGNIIALNEHGAVLHYTDMDRVAPAQKHSFLIDAGAQINGYASDITRTYSAHNDEFSALIAAMNSMELGLIENIRTGRPYLDVHIAAHQGVAGILNRFEFVNASAEEMIAGGATSTFYPHGIGHLLGLQVHDIGGRFANAKGELNPPPSAHPYLRQTRTIETDMIFTIEPGLYFIDMLLQELQAKPIAKNVNWAKVEAFKRFGGIRIEDNVLVTKTGTRNLTREAFA